MRRAFRGIFFFILLLSLIAALSGVYFARQFNAPGSLSEAKTLIFAKGSGVKAISATLEEEGVIGSQYSFQAAAVLLGKHTRFKPGEYIFPTGISPKGVLEMLTEGKTVIRRLTVAEGLQVADVRSLLLAESALSGDAPEDIAEGSLLPETYYFSYGDSRAELITRMQRALREALQSEWETRAPNLPLYSPRDALILASIVEKETALDAERSHVAAVYINRLRIGMKLQADPTTVYAVEMADGKLNRPLTFSDLKRELPYNTYFITGLPPGPIANPGRASIHAALHPMDSDDMYFVATGNGGHRFAKTTKEHEENVRRFRAAIKAAKEKP